MNTGTTHVLGIAALTAMTTMLVDGTARADAFNITSFEALVSASADGSDYKTDQYDWDSAEDSASSFAELPISVSASAYTDIGGGSGGGSVHGSLTGLTMSLSADGSGDGYGDDVWGSGSGSGDGEFTVEFTVAVPIIANVELYAYADGFGNIGNGWAALLRDGNIVESVDAESGFGESIFSFNFEPGVVYEVQGSGYGGGYSDSGGGSSASGSGSVLITALCADAGTVVPGDNAIDTTIHSGFDCDLAGHCDPGPYGDDTIHNAAYYGFTPETNTTYTFSTCNQATFDTRIAILETACDPSSVITCLDDTPGCGGFTTELSADLQAGVTYAIVVGGYSGGDLGTGTLTITALPLIVECTSLDATLESDAYAYFCGDKWEEEQSDDDNETANPASLAELPASVSAGAYTCCSDGTAGCQLSGEMGINTFTAGSNANATACGDSGGMCADGSSWSDARGTFSLHVSQYCELSMTWALYGDGGGYGYAYLRDPDGDYLVDEYADWTFNDGSTTIELNPGTYLLHVNTGGSGDPYACGGMGAEGYADVNLEFTALPNPNDINGDGHVNGADLALLLGSWGPCPGCPEDLNDDGVVDGMDLAILLGAWFSG